MLADQTTFKILVKEENKYVNVGSSDESLQIRTDNDGSKIQRTKLVDVVLMEEAKSS